MFKYRKAFLRNDGERYNAFLEAVSSGEKQLHADNLAPYEIVRSALDANRWGFNARLTDGEKAALNASWASLPDFCDNRNALAVVDTSGSMYCYDNALPAAVALSLGLYFGERNTGIFHNHFIEFSSRPQLIEIKGKTFAERLEYLCTFNEVADTNVEAVFDLILDAAVRNNVPQEELPETLYLISDMEFNACVRNASVSNFASAKRRFAEHGYRLPQIVFWNVASRNSNQPVTKNEQGVALVSGCTPRLFSMVASGDLSPYSVMMDIYNGMMSQPFLYTPWRKEHKDLAAIKVGDLVLTPGINMKAIQHFYDAIRKAFFKSEEYNWRWYKFRNRSEYVTYLRKHEEAE